MTKIVPPGVQSRRAVLQRALAAGLGVTFLASGAEAAAAGEKKMIVIVARGAMDGLSVCAPVGDPAYAPLRQSIALSPQEVLALDATFGLHPELTRLHALCLAGQARIAPAVAIPQRIRSHFEAQDLLETGGPEMYAVSTGWLNRALQAATPKGSVRALAVGAQEPLILRGPVQAESWSPGGAFTSDIQRLAHSLADLYADDPLLSSALATGLKVEDQASLLNDGKTLQGRDARAFAATAAKFLAAPEGPSIAVLSLDGFDTHARQGAAKGQLANRLRVLDDVIEGVHQGLGDQWRNTVLIVVTEFGRTARVNGTGGTDHGTASCAIIAGGAVKPGGIVGDWPTLASERLFEGRDLAPTLDVRSLFKTSLREHLGLDRSLLETAVFPHSAQAPMISGLIA